MARKRNAKREEEATEALLNLTTRQRKMVQGMAENIGTDRSMKSLAIAAGYSETSRGTAIAQTPSVKAALRKVLIAKGITSELLSEIILDGLTAREDHLDDTSKPERVTRLKFLEKTLQILGIENDGDSPRNWESMISTVTIEPLVVDKPTKTIDALAIEE